MGSVVQAVRDGQVKWAARSGVPIDGSGYTLRLDDNLFAPLSPEAFAEFDAGDGDELGADGSIGKMQALHSSSALACNVFEYWRGRDAEPLTTALGARAQITELRFEQKYPTGLRGNAPNLDVVLGLADGSVMAVESKFLEPYSAPHASGFRGKYFDGGPGIWSAKGLPACQLLAEAIQSGDVRYRWLNAEQLLKHALGLATSCCSDWSLWYMWFKPEGTQGEEHDAEARDFEARVQADGIGFRSVTYQRLLARLRDTCGEDHSDYLRYLGERYFV